VLAELQALKAQQARLVRPDHKVLRVKLALLVLKVQQALTERMAQQEQQALRVRLDRKAQQALLVQLGQLAQTALMERLQLLLLARFQQAQPDPVQQLQIQALPAQLYLRFRFHKALPALLEPLVLPELMVLQAPLDHKALQVQQVQREQPGHKVLRVPMAQMVRMALRP
jgi:hypothetical protein|tara:strand:- start:262 stop:771 length:510 start_codon:yes stop_codon:yes gene_type:complete